LLCDSGLLSLVFLAKPLFLEAYEEATNRHLATISTAVFIEVQHWLVIQRGLRVNPFSRAEYDRYRHRLDSYIVLNSDGVSDLAMSIARRWPDTGVGDTYTVATALLFDIPVFTLNPKHFERIKGLLLYQPDNYSELLKNVRRV
jgi:predicted nucleic acid-binding protein